MRVLFAMVVFSGVVRPDHLPEDLVARGKPETVLSGIDIYHSHTSDLFEKFGNPDTLDKYPKTEEAAEITWNRGGSRIHVTINSDDIAYAVRVDGKPSAITTTGRGLGLGQTLTDLQRIYGNKLLRHGNDLTVQWSDGTEMRARLANGRIVLLMLIADVE